MMSVCSTVYMSQDRCTANREASYNLVVDSRRYSDEAIVEAATDLSIRPLDAEVQHKSSFFDFVGSCGPAADHGCEGPPEQIPSDFLGSRGRTCDTRDLDGLPVGVVAGWLGSSSPGGTRSKRRQAARQERAKEQQSKAGEAVGGFCGKFPATRVKPTEAELEALLAGCSHLSRGAVSRALQEQLSWSRGDAQWQEQLRALHAVDYFLRQEGYGREVAELVLGESAVLLWHLASEVPQCTELAVELLQSCSDSSLRNLAL